jgi:hypothetical protein
MSVISPALPNSGKKSIRSLAMRPQTQIAAPFQWLGITHLGAYQQIRYRQGLKTAALLLFERCGHHLVLGVQQAACGIDQATAGPQQSGGTLEDAQLPSLQLDDV